MQNKFKIWMIAAAAAMLLSIVQPAFAAETPNAVGEAAKQCSLTLEYAYENKPLANLGVKLYRVADAFEEADAYQFSLTGAFADCPIHLSELNARSDLESLKSTVEGYVTAKQIQADYTTVTDGSGKASFSGLPIGVYYIPELETNQGNLTYRFASSIVVIPQAVEDNQYSYEAAASPKAAQVSSGPEEITYSVAKVWKDGSGADSRPESIAVEIYKDEVLQETVELSSDNDWYYEWNTTDDGANWTVVEKDVPSGYTVSVSQNDTGFVVLNTADTPGSPSTPSKTPSSSGSHPKTGDTSNIYLWIALSALSGAVLLYLGVRDRRDHETE